MRSRSFRRHRAMTHMMRRLKEDRNQHYSDLSCPCWTDLKVMAFLKEQPKRCSGDCCRNPRRSVFGYKSQADRLTLQERRNDGAGW